jgi:hypothetical protein
MVNNKDLAHVANIKSIEHLVLMLLLAFNILVKIYISKYFASYYKWKSLQRIYELPLQPVTLQELQPLDNDPLLPPIKKAKRGRPKVARIRANYKIDKHIHCCSVCSQAGHNRRVCPNQPVEYGRAQKVRDQRISKC